MANVTIKATTDDGETATVELAGDDSSFAQFFALAVQALPVVLQGIGARMKKADDKEPS